MRNSKTGKFPEKPDQIPVITDVWERLATFEKTQEIEQFSDVDVAKTLLVDKLRVLNALAVMQASIVYRAIRACDLYFKMIERTKSTENRTFVRPRIRLDKKYSTVEMAWVRRLYKEKPANGTDAIKKASGESKGRAFHIQTEKGTMEIFTWYSYLRKGTRDRYSKSIFKNEPVWAQKLGIEVEDKFELLRKEQKALSSIRRLIVSIDGLQMKQFNQMVQNELNEWSEGYSLKTLYNPDIDFDATSEY